MTSWTNFSLFQGPWVIIVAVDESSNFTPVFPFVCDSLAALITWEHFFKCLARKFQWDNTQLVTCSLIANCLCQSSIEGRNTVWLFYCYSKHWAERSTWYQLLFQGIETFMTKGLNTGLVLDVQNLRSKQSSLVLHWGPENCHQTKPRFGQ